MPVTHTKTVTIADPTQADLDVQIAAGFYPPGTVLADIALSSDWNDDHAVSVSVSEINASGTPSASTFLRGDGSWASAGGGSATWGSITGTLSAQTDLQTALNAKATEGTAVSFTSVNINGTAGNGHVHLKHQSSDPSSTGSSSTIFADSNGNPAWINDGLSKVTLDLNGITAARSYEFPDASGVVALTSDLTSKVTANAAITGATKTKITYDAKGLVTAGADATTADIADSSNKRYVTDAQLVVIGNTSGTNTGDQTITLTGDVTGSGTGSFAATIAADSVTFAKMQNIATDRLIGRDTALSGDPEEISVGGGIEFTGTGSIQTAAFTGDATKSAGGTALTLATVNSNVGSFGSASQVGTFTVNGKGLITAASNTAISIASSGVSDFTEAAQDAVGAMVDSTLVYTDATPLLSRAALTGDVTASAGSNSTTIANDAVSNAKLANMATATFKGRTTAGTGDPEDLTATQATALLDAFTSGAKGLAPASGGGTTNFLRADGSWAAPSGGSGDVVGPASATDNAVARFDSTTGKLIQNSGAILTDSDQLGLGGTPATGAKFEVISTSLASIPWPKMTNAQINSLGSLTEGLVAWDTDQVYPRIRRSFDWLTLTPGASAPTFVDPSWEDFYEETANGTNKIRVTAPDAIASNRTITWPDNTGTVALTSDITANGITPGRAGMLTLFATL